MGRPIVFFGFSSENKEGIIFLSPQYKKIVDSQFPFPLLIFNIYKKRYEVKNFKSIK